MIIENNIILEKKHIGIGKRKKSIARVFLFPGKGNLLINNKSGDLYLQQNSNYLNLIWLPLKKFNLIKNYDIITFVKGGGLSGQSEAIQLGICRLLIKLDSSYRKNLKKDGLLTRDARVKERKKYGLRKARKAPQYSKR